MRRRDFIKAGGVTALLASARADAAAVHNFDRYDFGPGPAVADRLYQGPFPTDRFAGWQVVMATTASREVIPDFGMGLITYLCDEVGPPEKPGESPGKIPGRSGAVSARHQVVPARELERRAAQAGPARSVRTLAHRLRPGEALRQAPRPARDDEQSGYRRLGAAGLPREARADGRARRVAEPAALRAALRRSGVPVRLQRADRPTGRRLRRPPAGRVRRHRDVRVLGRGPHLAASGTQSISGLRRLPRPPSCACSSSNSRTGRRRRSRPTRSPTSARSATSNCWSAPCAATTGCVPTRSSSRTSRSRR